MPGKYLTTKEAAEYLNVGESTLRQNLRSGLWPIPVIRLRSRKTKKAGRPKRFIQFDTTDLDRFMASQKTSWGEAS